MEREKGNLSDSREDGTEKMRSSPWNTMCSAGKTSTKDAGRSHGMKKMLGNSSSSTVPSVENALPYQLLHASSSGRVPGRLGQEHQARNGTQSLEASTFAKRRCRNMTPGETLSRSPVFFSRAFQKFPRSHGCFSENWWAEKSTQVATLMLVSLCGGCNRLEPSRCQNMSWTFPSTTQPLASGTQRVTKRITLVSGALIQQSHSLSDLGL